ncbi:hypothetical protein AAHC03_016504 [Spirometra sp. Aus1]
MTQSVFVQVGQCGNQIGYRFWDLALREYAAMNKTRETMQSFFSLDSKKKLSARAVLVDMEEGVVQELLRGQLGSLFESAHLITDVSGSGNNWLPDYFYFIPSSRAVGHCLYGDKHSEKILDALRRSVEACSSLQCFFILHSMGGGTGSGIGSFISQLLADEYPNVFRLVTAVFPSLDDDVITSPYNTVLALNHLTEFADCVVSVDNRALSSIVRRAQAEPVPRHVKTAAMGSVITSEGSLASIERAKPFDEMNNIVANMLLNLTSSARFPGTMNVDLNEISMNLVPFPRLHYLIAAQSPLCSSLAPLAPRNIDQIFKDAFSRDYQLLSNQPTEHTFLAASLLLRGGVFASDIRRNIERLQTRLRFVPWNHEGWKVGHCQVPAVGQKVSLLALSNSTAIRESLAEVLVRFKKLMSKKAHLHHYLRVEGFEEAQFERSACNLSDLIDEYAFFENRNSDVPLPELPRLRIAD